MAEREQAARALGGMANAHFVEMSVTDVRRYFAGERLGVLIGHFLPPPVLDALEMSAGDVESKVFEESFILIKVKP